MVVLVDDEESPEATDPESLWSRLELELDSDDVVLPVVSLVDEDDVVTPAATIATPRPPVRTLAAAIAAVIARAVRRPRSLVLTPRRSSLVLGGSYVPARYRPRTADVPG